MLLLLGDEAFAEWANPAYAKDYSLNEQRGYPLTTPYEGVQAICSYLPQEALDLKDYESKLNPLLSADTQQTAGAEDDEGEGDEEVKRHGRTSHSNYFFWLSRDTGKALHACRHAMQPSKYEVTLAPSSNEIISVLSETHSTSLYLDIETDVDDRNLLCIGLSFGDIGSGNRVYVVPFLRWNYAVAYNDYAKILRAFSVALRRNTIICHNAMFDLGVLAHKYSLPFNDSIYDTMLAQHRCFPEAEKSLGHSLSAWPDIWEPFHKDEGVFPPRNPDQEKQLWNYNAKDVWAMKLIKHAQLTHASKDAGLLASIGQANRMIRPYIISMLQGMRFRNDIREQTLRENDRLMTHYLRALRTLVGRELLPTSPQQCAKYLFEELDYPVQYKTDKGNPSTGDKAIQKLKLKFPNNAVLDFLLAYRERAKESGQLKFKPWIEPKQPIVV
jgi:DNA polymerase I-like protein with 3'-5' exonuclease and polymerase domains